MPLSPLCATFAGVALFAAVHAASGPAVAAGQRSFVSTSGVDNPTCSVAAPCRTFSAAIAATIPGGEVVVLDSGGYGAVAITQSVSITAPPGVYAGISVTAGDGIVVTTSVSDLVKVSGLTISNLGSGAAGIRFNGAGALAVTGVTVSGFQAQGMLVAPTSVAVVSVERSTFERCGWGIVTAAAAGGYVYAFLDRVAARYNSNAGIEIGDNSKATVRASTAFLNGDGVVAYGITGPTHVMIEASDLSNNNGAGVAAGVQPVLATVTVSSSIMSNNGAGIRVGNNGLILLNGTTITQNVTGIANNSNNGSGEVKSLGNNLVFANSAGEGAPTLIGAK